GHQHDRQHERARHQENVLHGKKRERRRRRPVVDAVDQPGRFFGHARSTRIQIGVATKKSEPTIRVSSPIVSLRAYSSLRDGIGLPGLSHRYCTQAASVVSSFCNTSLMAWNPTASCKSERLRPASVGNAGSTLVSALSFNTKM